ncbi:general stress protein [Aneurinibacillus sp. REN35]|uniref:general stress protein n=1 Tax=Aneurinibacillus sp. REN35 TaxID=3237286 RepID=UPI003526EC47
MAEKLVGVFKTEAAAIAALRALQQLGYKADDISLISKDKNEQAQIKTQNKNNMERGLMLGSVSGGVFGGVAGLVAGLGALAIPGIGPVIAAGPLVGLFTGAVTGYLGGSIVGALIGLGIPEEKAKEYDTHLKNGNILVIVDEDAGNSAQVREAFRTYGSINEEPLVE